MFVSHLYVFFGDFLIGSFIFLELSCISCLYIFEISCLSFALFAIIFSHSEGCLFTLLIVSFITETETEVSQSCPTLCDPMDCSLRLFATPWTVAYQAPLSMGLFRQEYWKGLPCPPPRDFPNPGTGPVSVSCTGRRVLYH